MAFTTDDTRRAVLRAADGEDFETGYPEPLLAKFAYSFELSSVGQMSVENSTPFIRCVTSDVTLHRLVKQSVIRRVADDKTYTVKRLEPDHGGMTTIRLSA